MSSDNIRDGVENIPSSREPSNSPVPNPNSPHSNLQAEASSHANHPPNAGHIRSESRDIPSHPADSAPSHPDTPSRSASICSQTEDDASGLSSSQRFRVRFMKADMQVQVQFNVKAEWALEEEMGVLMPCLVSSTMLTLRQLA